MEVIMSYFLCLLTRKKSCLYILYFIGIVIFVSLSYNTANQLYGVPVVIVQSSITTTTSQISTISLSTLSSYHGDRNQYLENKCHEKDDVSYETLPNILRRNDMLNHLGFVVRSHNLFYCSVPKVATRTLLTFITYLHIRDDLIPLLANNSTSKLFNLYPYLKSINNSNIFNVNYFKQTILSSSKNGSLSNSISILTLFLSNFIFSNNSNLSRIDFWSIYQNKILPLTRLRTLPDPSIIFSFNFLRVIFVRHPLERLASAYIDKITSLKNKPFSLYDNLRRAICRKYAASYLTKAQLMAYRTRRKSFKQIGEPCENVIPKFDHFIEYLMSDSLQNDVHWQSYSKLCYVCKLKYNFIGKYERIEEDLKQFLISLGLNSIHWNHFNYFTNGKTKENYKLMYSKLSNKLICYLKHFYKDDLELFSYRLEDYLDNQQVVQCSASLGKKFKKYNQYGR